jgi:hypothetical protein
MGPWLDSLSTDLFGATAYQVTAEIITLAENLRDHGEHATATPEDLPAPWGFAWLDSPIGTANTAGVELPVHAFSWAQVPSLRMGATRARPGVRLRCWSYLDSPQPWRMGLSGQVTFQLVPGGMPDDPGLRLIHKLWLLMGMEITAISRELPDRHARKRAANLRHQHVNVVTLRRPKHAQPASGGPHRHVDWSCTWIVRGHTRHYDHALKTGPNAGQTEVFIKPYLKGPDGLPLRASDILYRLSR